MRERIGCTARIASAALAFAAVSCTYGGLGVASRDPSTGQMGTVDIEILFTAIS